MRDFGDASKFHLKMASNSASNFIKFHYPTATLIISPLVHEAEERSKDGLDVEEWLLIDEYFSSAFFEEQLSYLLISHTQSAGSLFLEAHFQKNESIVCRAIFIESRIHYFVACFVFVCHLARFPSIDPV